MGLFGFGKKKQAAAQSAAPQFEVGGTETVVSIPGATMLNDSKYFVGALNSIVGDTIQVQIVGIQQAGLKYGDFAVVLPGMVPIGTISQYKLDKVGAKCGDVVTAIVQRPPDSGDYVKLWVPIAK